MAQQDKQLTISVSQINGIREPITLEIPRWGGIVELLGRNGAGKTTTTNLILAAHGEPSAQLSGTDGGVGQAQVTDGERSIQLTLSASKMSKKGQPLLGLAADQGKALATLIEPNLKDPEAAERERLKAIAAIYPRVEFTAAQLELLTTGLDCQPVVKLGKSDVGVLDAAKIGAPLPDLAGAVKRSLEACKRDWERKAAELEGVHKDAKRELEPLAQLEDPAISVGEAQDFQRRCAADVGRLSIEWQRRQAATQAREALVARIQSRQKPDVEAARAEAHTAGQDVRRLEAELARAREREANARSALSRIEAEHRQWQADQEALANDILPGCDEPVLVTAREALASAEQILSDAQGWARKQALISKLKQLDAEKADAKALAEAYETAAQAVWRNLGKVMAQAGIQTFTFDDGVLAVVHEGQVIPYKDLSFGLRVFYGFKAECEALAQAGEANGPKLCALEPDFWLALDPERRLEVDAMAVEAGLTVLTERPARGDLRAESYCGE